MAHSSQAGYPILSAGMANPGEMTASMLWLLQSAITASTTSNRLAFNSMTFQDSLKSNPDSSQSSCYLLVVMFSFLKKYFYMAISQKVHF